MCVPTICVRMAKFNNSKFIRPGGHNSKSINLKLTLPNLKSPQSTFFNPIAIGSPFNPIAIGSPFNPNLKSPNNQHFSPFNPIAIGSFFTFSPFTFNFSPFTFNFSLFNLKSPNNQHFSLFNPIAIGSLLIFHF
jgi:hypothetical protein